MARHFNIAIAGGGLAGSLIALALAARRPDLSVALIEAGDTFGGNHVWSFFDSDVAPPDRGIVEPLIAARWDQGYDVRFPDHSRTLPTAYRSVTSQTLDRAVRETLPTDAIITGQPVESLSREHVVLKDGERVAANTVIDARGIAPAQFCHLSGGWQKFVGQMLTLSQPHGLTRPVVMDATVEQVDGYRFVYCLPFSDHDVFVEDTYYSDTPDLDTRVLSGRIAAYAKAQGWQVASVSRQESGVLPVVTDGEFDRFASAGQSEGVLSAGVRAGLFQPLTSYSLPDAVRFASFIADYPGLTKGALDEINDYAWAHWRRGGFYRLLARMLFGAADPAERYRVLQRFYRLDGPLVERFYAGRSTLADKLRILAGKPPVPIGRAAMVIAGLGAPDALDYRTTEGSE